MSTRSQENSASLEDGHKYVGWTDKADRECELCGERCDRHEDQKHYCEDCHGSHYGNYTFCSMGEPT